MKKWDAQKNYLVIFPMYSILRRHLIALCISGEEILLTSTATIELPPTHCLIFGRQLTPGVSNRVTAIS